MKYKNIISTTIIAVLVLSLSLACWFKPHTVYSESERRPLAEKPELSVSTIASGEYMKNFEQYATDQFPIRDKFRTLKAFFANYFLNKKDNNGLFVAEGHISKLEYPVNPDMVENAVEKFDYLYETYMKDTDANIYLSVIPDKNYFLAEKNGYISIDYKKFAEDFSKKVSYMKYIDILPHLSLDCYYKTDSHWKQEEIVHIAEFIAESMGQSAKTDYKINTLSKPFNGVYKGQSALPFQPDTIKYLTNDALDNCTVKYYDTGMAKEGSMYNMEKAEGKDPYEMFLSGTSPLIEIENEMAETEKELVIFRDSFGSSLTPLLVPAYRKITVVDIRYIQSAFVGNYVKFDNQDVLFIYSTTLLNNSMAMR